MAQVRARSGVRVGFKVKVRVRYFVETRGHKWLLCGSVAEGGVTGSASGV